MGQHAPNQGIPCRIGRFLFRHLKNAGYEGRSWRQLLRDLTINVTQFFRDEAVFRALEDEVLPLLIYRKVKRGETSIRIWSAGCSSGQEPYSMAILMRELLGEEFDKFSVSIVASDIDEEVLESARRGVYVPRQVVNVNPTYLARHFTLVDGKYQVSPEIMDMVRFRNIDLFTSTAGSHFDMILCRNVVIYFTREMQERLYMKFHSSLRPGGYLVMGNTETLVGEAVHLFRPVRPRERIYQKADASYP
ncbi:MAG TPA: protein-glutamate O-methyltransferase CheR [Methanomassiliicoccaceae archaeon]|nr:protein-glutamate O-methyltransferase CheR [Methanomassiliicoccaceae archaeon]